MSAVVDEKIVSMKFDNKQFESGVKTSLNTIDKLKKSLDFDDASKSMDKLSQKAKEVDFSVIQKGVELLADRFSTWGIVGMRVIENLTDKLMGFVGNITGFVKSGIIEGGISRANKLEDAHFTLQGLLKDEEKVQAVMKDVNESVDGTAYGLDEAAVVASSLVASGVQAGDQLLTVLKAIAGVAAVSNADYSQIGHIFTTIYGNGRIMGMQLNQLSTQSLNVASLMAQYFNQVNEGIIEVDENIKKTIQDISAGRTDITEFDIRKWISDPKTTIGSDIFSAVMSYNFADQATKANETVKGVVKNIRSALARIGAGFYSPLIAQNNEVVELFNSIRVKINEVKKELVFDEKLNNVMALSKRFGDYVLGLAATLKKYVDTIDGAKVGKVITNVIDSIVNVLKGLWSVAKPILQAFRDIFPPASIDRVLAITEAIKEFTSNLRLSDEESDNLRRTFAGLFAIIDILKQAFNAIVKVLLPAGSVFEYIGDSLLSFTAKIGDYIVKLDEFIKENDIFTESVNAVKEAVSVALDFIKAKVKVFVTFISPKLQVVKDLVIDIGDTLRKFGKEKFGSPDTKGLENFSDRVSTRLKPLQAILNAIRTAVGAIVKVLEWVWNKISPLLLAIGDALANGFIKLWNRVSAAADFDSLIDILNAGALFTLIEHLYNLTKDLDRILTLGAYKKVKDILLEVKNTLTVYQQVLKAKILKEIAVAIAILAASMVALSLVDSNKLTMAMAAMTAGMGDLMVAFKIVDQSDSLNGKIGDFKILSLGLFMQEIALAMLEIAGAMAIISQLDVKELAVGLAGFGGALAMMVSALMPISLIDKDKMTKAGVAMVIMAAAVKVAVSAMKDASSMSWEEMAKGLTGFGGALLILVSAFMPLSVLDKKKMLTASESLILMAASTKVAISAMKDASSMSWEEMAKGITAFGGTLLILASAFMPLSVLDKKKMLTASESLILMAASTKIAVSVVKDASSLSWEEMAKGLTAFGGTLLILASAFMPLSVLDKKKMLIASESLILMATSTKIAVSVVKDASSLNWEELGKGLIAFGSVLTMLVVAFTAVGAVDKKRILAASTSLVLIATSMDILLPTLNTMAKMDINALTQAIVGFGSALAILIFSLAALQTMPSSSKMLASSASILIMANAILVLAPALKILGSMKMSEIIKALIAVAGAFTVLGVAGTVLAGTVPAIIGLAGAITLLGVGIALVGGGILALSTGLTVLGATGLVGLTAFVTTLNVILVAIPTLIRNTVAASIEAVVESVDLIIGFIKKLAGGVLDVILELLPKVLNIIGEIFMFLFEAIVDYGPEAVKLIVDLLFTLVEAIAKNSSKFTKSLVKLVVDMITELVKAIPVFVDKLYDVAVALIEGFGQGFRKNFPRLMKAILGMLKDIFLGILDFFGIHSPSTKMMEVGANLVLGLIEGILGLAKKLLSVLLKLGGQIIEWLIKGIKNLPDTLLQVGKWIWNMLEQGLKAMFTVVSAIGGLLIETFIKGVKNLAKSLFEVGKWIWNTIKGAITGLWNEVKNIGSKIGGWIKDGIEGLGSTLIDTGKKVVSWITGESDASNITQRSLQKIYDKLEDPEQKRMIYEKAKAMGIELDTGVSDGVSHQESIMGALMALQNSMDDPVKREQLMSLAKGLGIKIEDKTAEGIDSGETLLHYLYLQVKDPEQRQAVLDAAKQLGYDIEGNVSSGVKATNGTTQHMLEILYDKITDPEKKKALIAKAAELGYDLGKTTADGFETGVKGLQQSALYAVEGFIQGMSDADRRAAAAAGKLGGAAVTGAKKALKTNSPSKVMIKIGEYFSEGFAIGIEDNMYEATDASKQMANTAILNIAYAMAKIQDIMDSEEMNSPVIKPVLDLSDVTNGMTQLDSMFDSDYVLKASDGIYGNQNVGNVSSVNKTFNFTQNNYSPKSLSRIDIYRQTRNQFSALERMATL